MTEESKPPSERAQIFGSLLVALVIVAITIAVVTALFGPTSAAELEGAEDRAKERTEAVEERAEAREEAADEAAEAREEAAEPGGSGPG